MCSANDWQIYFPHSPIWHFFLFTDKNCLFTVPCGSLHRCREEKTLYYLRCPICFLAPSVCLQFDTTLYRHWTWGNGALYRKKKTCAPPVVRWFCFQIAVNQANIECFFIYVTQILSVCYICDVLQRVRMVASMLIWSHEPKFIGFCPGPLLL